MTDLPQAAVSAARDAIAHIRDRGATSIDLARAALEAAAPHMGRPVYVLAVGHDLTGRDAENIQRAVVTALRTTEGGHTDGT